MGSRQDLRYRPFLDGVRMVAVYLVVAFHARLGLWSGGFVGVDVFFVLSGFLVTRILVRDLASAGRVQWRTFYARRVRRILPAALIALVVTAIAYSIVASPVEMADALGGFRAAFFYVANWFFIRQSTNYFAANVNTNPVLHFWSLAVEEQFYLAWPLLLGSAYFLARRAGRYRWWVLRGVVVAAGVASAVAALHIGATNLDRAYYGTDTRAYQLLAGAALALSPQLLALGARFRRAAGWASGIALAALVVFATSAFTMSAITRGIVVTALTGALLVALENARGGPARRVLSWGPCAYLGRISYGTYLWHWPVVVLVTHDYKPDPVQLFVTSAVCATALAALSYHLVEHPVRVSGFLDRHKAPVIAIGFATSILTGALLMPVVLGSAHRNIAAAATDYLPLDYHDCYRKPVAACTVVNGTGPRVVLVGDSIARMWIPAFTEIAQKMSWTFSVAVHAGCPWQRGLEFATGAPQIRDCQARQDDWYDRVLPAFHPDIVFLAQHGYDDPNDPNAFVLADHQLVTAKSGNFEQVLIDSSDRSLGALRAPGRKIVIIEPVPDAPFNPLNCLSLGRSTAKCSFRASKGPSPLERFFRSVDASRPDVTSIDVDTLACPHLPTCDAAIGDTIVWRDIAHLTGAYARSVAPDLETVLRRRHVLAAP